MKGRNPKPTNLKLVLGNPGRRPLKEDEPKPDGMAIKPKFLSTRASEIWDQYCPELTRIGILTSVDSHMFAAWCSLAEELEIDPKMMTAARIAQMRSLASAFGMDASARVRLGRTPDGKSHEDPAAAYFAA